MALENAPSALDSFDLAILRILQRDNALPHRKVAEQVNLSTASVQRRVKKMERDGTIAAQSAQINPVAVGLALTILVEVELKAETGGRIDEIKRTFLDTPQIQQCYYVTGEVDFVLVVIVSDMAEYEALTKSLFFPNENIQRFRTFVAMDRTRATMHLNI